MSRGIVLGEMSVGNVWGESVRMPLLFCICSINQFNQSTVYWFNNRNLTGSQIHERSWIPKL